MRTVFTNEPLAPVRNGLFWASSVALVLAGCETVRSTIEQVQGDGASAEGNAVELSEPLVIVDADGLELVTVAVDGSMESYAGKPLGSFDAAKSTLTMVGADGQPDGPYDLRESSAMNRDGDSYRVNVGDWKNFEVRGRKEVFSGDDKIGEVRGHGTTNAHRDRMLAALVVHARLPAEDLAKHKRKAARERARTEAVTRAESAYKSEPKLPTGKPVEVSEGEAPGDEIFLAGDYVVWIENNSRHKAKEAFVQAALKAGGKARRQLRNVFDTRVVTDPARPVAFALAAGKEPTVYRLDVATAARDKVQEMMGFGADHLARAGDNLYFIGKPQNVEHLMQWPMAGGTKPQPLPRAGDLPFIEEYSATSFFVHDEWLYWCAMGQVWRLSIQGGAPQALIDEPGRAELPPREGHACALADDAFVYYQAEPGRVSERNSIARVPNTGKPGTPTMVMQQFRSYDWVSDATHIYLPTGSDVSWYGGPQGEEGEPWPTEDGDGGILAIAKLDGTRASLIDGIARPSTMAIDATGLYWVSRWHRKVFKLALP